MTQNPLELVVVQKHQHLSQELSLVDLWKLFVETKGDITPKTIGEYTAFGKRFCDFMLVREICPSSLLEYIQDRRSNKKAGANWINKEIAAIRGFMRFLKRMRALSEDYSECLPTLPRESVRPTVIFTDRDYREVIDFCNRRTRHVVHGWLVMLGYRTGMSLIDCCHLRWSEVELNESGMSYIRRMRIKTAKRGESSIFHVPLVPGSDIYDALVERKKVAHMNYNRFDGVNDYVHQDCPGLYAWQQTRISDSLTAMFESAGIKGHKTFRHLRTTFVSNLVNAGVSPALICKMTGHTDVSMLMKYLKPDFGAMHDSVMKSFQFATETTNANSNDIETYFTYASRKFAR